MKMHPPRGEVVALAAGLVGRAMGKDPPPTPPPPPPKTLRQGWLKCRTDGGGDGKVPPTYEDFWCSLDTDGVLAFYSEQPASGDGCGAPAAPRLALQLREACLEEHPAEAPGERGLSQLTWALKRRHRTRRQSSPVDDAAATSDDAAEDAEGVVEEGGGGGAAAAAADSVVVRAASLRERAVWLAALSPLVATSSTAGGGSAAKSPAKLFAFMEEQDERVFRSLPRRALGPARGGTHLSSASLRRPWRASLHSPSPPPLPSLATLPSPSKSPSAGSPKDESVAPTAAPRRGGGGSAGGSPVVRRASLREVARRAREAATRVGGSALAWSSQPEVVEARAAERLTDPKTPSVGRLRAESLRLWLALGEAQYNAELTPLAVLARRSAAWLDPTTPAYARRTLAQLVEKVKRCSDGALSDMEQMWQKRLTFDGILGVLQKHMDKFDIFIAYSSHLQELSNIFSGASVKKSEVAAQAYSELFHIERVYLPLVRLVAIRKILQEMRGLLDCTNLDHFQCKRTLFRITEVLDECYKVLAAAYDSSFVTSLDKKLNDCCDDLVPVSFEEVIKKPEPAPRTTIPSKMSEESISKPRSNTFPLVPEKKEKIARTKSDKTPQLPRKNSTASKSQVLSHAINGVIGLRSTLVREKPKNEVRDSGVRTLPKRLKSSVFYTDIKESSPEDKKSSLKSKSSLPKQSKKSFNSKAVNSEKIIFNPQRISIIDIPLNDENSKDVTQMQHISTEKHHNVQNHEKENRKDNSYSSDVTVNTLQLNKSSEESEETNRYLDTSEESVENSDHSGSSRSTLYGGPSHLSSSECTLNGDETSSNISECDKTENEQLMHKNQSSGKTTTSEAVNPSIDHPYYDLSMYYNNELYSSSDIQSNHKKSNDNNHEDNYDYVYVTDNESGENTCQCDPCKNSILQEHSPTTSEHLSLQSDFNDSIVENNADYEDNIYEDVQYVDMNSTPTEISETTTTQDSDFESNNIYDDIGVYVRPDLASLRSSSERSRYSSDSGTIDDTSHTYYNSPSKCGSPLSLVENLEDHPDDMHDETDSAIESGSDTGRLHAAKISRTPSNASISLQNMVRWRNAQPSTPERPRKRTPRTPSLESPFDDAPLYQEYYMSSISQSKEREIKPSSDEEKTYIYVEPKEHVYETLDDYLLSRDMKPLTDTFRRRDKRERCDSRRTQWCETEEVLEKGLLEGMSVEQRRLQEAKFEIITSEVSFLKSLNILEKYFINNSDLYSKEAISEEDRQTLFLPIVPVKETSQWFLQDLVKVWEDNIILNNSQLADVLLKYAKGRFRVYIAYCSRQVDINVILAQLREKNRKFVEIIERIEEKPVCQAFSLQSFLTQPMQRITRFPMLVSAIIRQLPEEDISVPLWKNVLSTLQMVVNECNEAVRNAERTLAQRKEDKKKSFWTRFKGRSE